MYDILQLNDMLVPQLKDLAGKLGLDNIKRLSKQDLIYKILDHQAIQVKSKTADKPDDDNKISKNEHQAKRHSSAILAKKDAEIMVPAKSKNSIESKEMSKPDIISESEDTQNDKKGRKRINKPTDKDSDSSSDDQNKAEGEKNEPQKKEDEYKEVKRQVENSPNPGTQPKQPVHNRPNHPHHDKNRPKANPATEVKSHVSAPTHEPKQPVEPRFSPDLDGVIDSEGILELMPEGYGFLRSSDYNYL